MNYKLYFTKRFEKDVKYLNKKIKEILNEKLQKLKENPYIGRPLRYKLKGLWSLRIERYRLIYRVDEKEKKIILIALDHRKNIYKILSMIIEDLE